MERDQLISVINKKPLVLFGASQAAVNFLDSYPFLKIDCFWDNTEGKWGSTFLEKEITSPQSNDVFGQGSPFIIITSMYLEEISSQLIILGFVEGDDFISFDRFNRILGKGQFFQPGHFYSPIPDILEIQRTNYFEHLPKTLKGVNLNSDHQIKMFCNLRKSMLNFKSDYTSFKFKRFHLNNNYFEQCDAAVLYSMILAGKPKRIIEVGSGFSSALMLDVKNLYQLKDLELTFIEPFPERLESLLENKDYEKVTIYKEKVQSIDKSIFEKLEEDDILFIDSSHVSKIGSDVNHIIFEILPRLKPGVKIHFHDIFYPFEYPEKWVYEGRFWNEAYLLRAFLQYNHDFEIDLWNHYFTLNHRDMFNETFDELPGGGSLWLRKK